LKQQRERSTNLHALRGRNYRRGSFLGQLKVQEDRAPTRWRPLSSGFTSWPISASAPT
jgi:hypothetical protein